ncbi:Uncharacterised protein [Bordetella pertussis]|nr:Uncharacterised protein [Bordetella pertussis]
MPIPSTEPKNSGTRSGSTRRNCTSTSARLTVATGRPPFWPAGSTTPRLAK